MNPAAFGSSLAGAGGEGLWHTNPVLCLDGMLTQWQRTDAGRTLGPDRLLNLINTLVRSGIRLPASAMNRWLTDGHIPASVVSSLGDQQPTPGVVGLAVDGTGETAYVFPLHPTAVNTGWWIDAGLPFSPTKIQDGLAGLLQGCDLPNCSAVPERLAFKFENPTGLTARGDSMTVAAILAVVDHLGKHTSSLFRAAAALVEFYQGGELRSVANIPQKLAAAAREYGALSLIVGPKGVDRSLSENVWEVESLHDLAGYLHHAGVLTPLLDMIDPLTRSEIARVFDRLRQLIVHDHDFFRAADLGDRVRRCGFADPPDPNAWVEFARLHAHACRHNGRFEDAVNVGREAHQRVENLGVLGCDDEEADSAAEYAASLFNGHRFGDVPFHLQKWSDAALREPRRFRPLTRVKVWNTLGRALAVLGKVGWDELFQCSLRLQRNLGDEENAERTTNYLVHARLRTHDLVGARNAFDAVKQPNAGVGGPPWVEIVRADLARLAGEVWEDPALDGRLRAGQTPYASWRYVQSTARQSGRDLRDVNQRLAMAISLLRGEARDTAGNICNLFASFLALNAAARNKDFSGWQSAGQSAAQFLSNTDPHLRSYYGSMVDRLVAMTTPDVTAAEELLGMVPYF